MRVVVTRDSVAAGDDADAPHRVSFEPDCAARIGEVFKHLEQIGYLPWVDGRGHRWYASAGSQTVAEFVANRRQPEFTKLLASPLTEFAVHGELRIHFRYSSARY